MAKHKLELDDILEEGSFTLMAIHCSLEDYRLAYLLNQFLLTNLERKKEDLDYDNLPATYSIFEWEDMNHLTTWNLVSNICRKESDVSNDIVSLFDDQDKTMTTYNLISEYTNVDYFLKISSEGYFTGERNIINRILEIPQVVTAYKVDTTELKSKNNLIFN